MNINFVLGEFMNKVELIAPCHFGLGAVLKREIIDLGYEIAEVEDAESLSMGMRMPSAVLIFSFERQREFCGR